MTWDPSIILSGKQYTGPDPNETMRTLGQLMLMKSQQQQHEASLADLLNQRAQAQALRGVYTANANTPEKLPAALMGIGDGAQAFAAQDQAAQMAASHAAIQKQETEIFARAFRGVKDQAGLDSALTTLKGSGLFPDQHLAMLPTQYNDQTAPLIKHFESLGMTPKESADLEQKGAELEERKNWHTQMAGEKTVADGTGQRFKYNPETDAYDIPVGKPKAAGGGAGGDGGTSLSPEALEREARSYNLTHQLPTMGTGKSAAADKKAIMNRAAQLAAGNDDAGLAGAAGDYKANAASLKKFQTTADNTMAAEETARKNLETALSAASKIPDFGGSLLNKPIRAWSNMLGNTDMSGYKAAITTARTEISKVLSGSTGAGGVSDSARHEVEALMGDDATPAQLQAAAKILRTDMDNRKAAVEDQIKAIRGRMTGKKASPGGGGAAGGAATVTVRRKADGKTKTLSADDAAQVLVDPAYEQVP